MLHCGKPSERSQGIVDGLEVLLEYVSMSEAAEILGLHPQTVGRMVRRGDLATYRIATNRRVRLVSVEQLNSLREVRPDHAA